MGKDGLWKAGIQRVMQETAGGGKGFRKRFKEGQQQNLPMDTSTAESLHMSLDRELKRAMGDAITGSKDYTDIRRRQYVRERTAEYLKRGQQKEALEYLEYTKKKYSI